MNRTLLAQPFLWILAGCAVLPTPRQETVHQYLLAPDEISVPSPRTCSAPWQKGEILLVATPLAQPGFDTSRMAYSTRPYEIAYFAENEWADVPAKMVARMMVRHFARAGSWGAVLRAPNILPARYQLDTRNLAITQEFFRKPSRLRIALSGTFIDIKEERVVAARDFEILEDAPSDDPYGGVVAANEAAAKLLDQMAAWIGACGPRDAQAAR